VKRYFKSFRYAFDGIWAALKTERNLRTHAVLSLVAIGLGIFLGLPAVKWCLVIFAIGFVLAAELFNTAIEQLGDEAAAGKQKSTVKTAKDAAAGGVLLSAVAALVIGIIILVVPLVERFIS
jgi:diacylglycerol kinase